MKITLGFSPCPNDTFIFDAMVNGKIDTGGFEFEVVLEDVQTLNDWAKQGKLDCSKISYGVLPLILKDYIVLSAGGALGKGVGPLLIAAEQLEAAAVNDATIAIPGENTTANLLFSTAFPEATNKKYMLFNAVEDFVLNSKKTGNGKPCLGVIIHENRFTYQQKGLKKIMDLGEYWETNTGYPIPLGGIVMRRDFDNNVQLAVNKIIQQSLAHAFDQQQTLSPYVKQHAQEMSEEVMRKHIDLYVNDYSLDLGDEGKKAVMKFLEIYSGSTGQKITPNQIFI
jgi:1,4-dihydroxy-6-naphthoate synthase